jgi:uridine kinase
MGGMGRKPLIIGVAGGTGSGKTTIVNAIIEEVGHSGSGGSGGVTVLQHDSYYREISHLPMSERSKINFDHPDALETDLLVEHVKALASGRDVEMPVYDFTVHNRNRAGVVKKPAPVIIVEGILILVDPALRDLMDVKLFVDTDNDLRFIRRLRRDITERGRTMESVINQYLETVRPMHVLFVEPSRRWADVIIPEGHNPVSTGLVVSLIRHRLTSTGT